MELSLFETGVEEAPASESEIVPDGYAVLAFDIPVYQEFHYRIPEKLRGEIQPGSLCLAPFGSRKLPGICTELADESPVDSTRPIFAQLQPEPVLDEELFDLCRFVSNYYGCSYGEALHAALPGGIKKGTKRRRPLLCHLAEGETLEKGLADLGRRSPRSSKAVEILKENGGTMLLADLREALGGVRKSALKPLTRRNIVTFSEAEEGPAPSRIRKPGYELTDEQKTALKPILEAVEEERYAPFLLHGVTGSGKTEIYIRAIESVLDRGKRAIVLVPEIALTPQLLGQLRARLPGVVVLHSMQTQQERAASWEWCADGRVQVVIGPRSAIFAPLPDVGIIVVDEEHEGTYKQQETDPRYHARDLALVRARSLDAVCILGSATPSVESWQNGQTGRYELLRLTDRATGARMPDVKIVDMVDEIRESKGRLPVLSRTLLNRLGEAMARGEQAILFLNRRGFSTFVTCKGCGWALRCEQCDIALTFHRAKGTALCHYCGYSTGPPNQCPACEQGPITMKGSGTEKAEQAVARYFPDVATARLDSDSIRSGTSLKKTLHDFAEGRTQILIGTQMVAKGLNVHDVTVVGVLNADTSLHLPDFRAAERTFQLLSQVAGRAGRGDRPGVTIIQTFQPDHPVIRAAAEHDFDAYIEREIEARRTLRYPPFGRLMRCVISGLDERATIGAAHEVAERMRQEVDGPEILGPAPCPIGMIRKRHRWQILCKSPTVKEIGRARQAVQGIRLVSDLRLGVDVDPVSML